MPVDTAGWYVWLYHGWVHQWAWSSESCVLIAHPSGQDTTSNLSLFKKISRFVSLLFQCIVRFLLASTLSQSRKKSRKNLANIQLPWNRPWSITHTVLSYVNVVDSPETNHVINKLLKLDFIATHCVQFCWYLFSSSFYTVFFCYLFIFLHLLFRYCTWHSSGLKGERKIILTMKRKYLQLAERNTFTFSRMTMLILFFSCLVCFLKLSMKVLIVVTMMKRPCLLFACCVQQLATKVGSTDISLNTNRCMATPGELCWPKT